jgi:hypothetical protein
MCCSSPQGLSHIAAEYAQAICATPHFEEALELPGIPDGGFPTVKFSAVSKFSMATSLDGHGYVSVEPYRLAINALGGIFTNSAPAATGDVIGEAVQFTARSPIEGVDNGFVRLVGGCICVTYDGTLLDINGHYVGRSVTVGTVLGADESDLLSLKTTSRCPIKYGKTFCSAQTPILPAANFLTAASGYGGEWMTLDQAVGYGYHNNAVMIQAAPGDPFVVTVHYMFEWLPAFSGGNPIGPISGVGSMLTPSMSDPVGLSAVRTAFGMHPHTGYVDASGGLSSLARSVVRGAESLLGAGVRGAALPIERASTYFTSKALASLASRYAGPATRALTSGGASNYLLEGAELGLGLLALNKVPKRATDTDSEETEAPGRLKDMSITTRGAKRPLR